MKRHALSLALLMTLVALAASPSSAIFPNPDGSDVFALFQGYLDNDLVWFTGFETNDIKLASSILFADFIHAGALFSPQAYHYPQFAPKLSSALVPNPANGLTAARPMYVVLNYQQGPVLTTRPGDPEYSGLWQLFFVQWLPGATPRTIKNDAAPGTDSLGLPSAAEATITPSNIVFSCPIIAIGRIGDLSGPYGPMDRDYWDGPADLGSYVIPEAIKFSPLGNIDTPPKWVRLPVYVAWFEDPVTKATWSADELVITDTTDPALAKQLGLNLAPGLANMPDADTQIFWTFAGPQPPGQLPLMSAGPSTSAAPFHDPIRDINKFYDYSPVMDYTVLQRNIPQYVTVASKRQLLTYLGSGALTVLQNDRRILAHVSFIDKFRFQPGQRGVL